MDGSASLKSITNRDEKMRIGGELVDTDGRIEVFNPWNNEVVGTVPRGTSEHAAKAFDIAGKGIADPSSLRQAVVQAQRLVAARSRGEK